MAQKDILVFADWKGLDGPVKIGNLHCLSVRGKEVFSFEYDKNWIDSGKYHLLDPDLKLLSGPQYPGEEKTNFGLFLDSSPDRWGRLLMNRREAFVARKEGRKPKPLQESDYLLGVHDIFRLGGLRFKLEEAGPFLDDDQNLAIPLMTRLRELEEASLQLEKDESFNDTRYSAWLNLLLAPGSSIGGARPKANVFDLRKGLWIAKFPSRSDLFDTGGWEMVVWELARRSGLSVPESKAEIYSQKGHTFLTKRFDRTQRGERIHFASAMTLLGYIDGTDFKDGASYLEIAEFLMQNGVDVNSDLEEVWRRIVFSICVRNTDDHLRNHGFLLTDRGWKLSPAYDLNPNPSGNGLTLNISLTDNSLDLELALEVRSFFRLTDKRASEIIEQVKKEVRNWKRIAEKVGIPRQEQEMMSQAFFV
ncbi:MAG: HipA domain-containing protein [Bacteroidetes bacterium]|nr:HipA domain-containing protein [Bacteroidota bacterium]